MRNTVFFVITLVVLVAGVYFGKRDFERDRRPVPPVEEGSPTPVAPATEEPPDQPDQQDESVQASPPTRGPDPDEVKELVSDLESDIVELGPERVGRAVEKQLEGYLQDFEADFDRDASLAAGLDPLRRLESKCKVFAALVDPIERDQLPDPIHEIQLTNGNVLMASQIRKSGEKYQISTINPKGTAGLPLDEVQKVVTVPRSKHLEKLADEISAAAAKFTSPIDLYLKGVTRAYRSGLDTLGYELLERLLAMDGSKQVPSIFAHDPEGVLVASWEQAAGRSELPRLAFGRATSSPPAARGDRVTTAPENLPAGLHRSVVEARRLYERARQTYRDVVVNRRGDLDELHGARDELDRATAILDTLSAAHPEVQKTKAEVVNLRSAIIKSLPF